MAPDAGPLPETVTSTAGMGRFPWALAPSSPDPHLPATPKFAHIYAPRDVSTTIVALLIHSLDIAPCIATWTPPMDVALLMPR